MTTLLLENDTIGTTETKNPIKIGSTVTVTLHDENGLLIEVTGKVVEILDWD